jgi:mannose/cellobiose epimerase-like protein (N-acyl-D-glucosamine 2-epimerase family)
MIKFVIIPLFLVFGCCVAAAQTQAAGNDKVQRMAERSMEIRRMVVQDKTNAEVTVDGKQYKWFADRKAAITYFNNMTIKYDMIIVYIDSADPNPEQPDIISVSEPVIRRAE